MKKVFIKVKSILISEEVIIAFLSLILIFFSYGPLTMQYLTPPPEGKVYLGSYGFPPDFWGNIISYREGRLGHWLFTHKITTTINSPATFSKIEYLALGQLSRYFPVDPIIFFHICRGVLSVFLLMVIYKLISLVLKNKVERIIAYGLALLSAGAGPGADLLVALWSPSGVFQRSAYYPHYLFAFIFILLTLIFLIKALSEKKISKLLLACFFGFLTSIIHAPNTFSLYLTFPFYLGLLTIGNLKNKVPLDKWLYKPIFLIFFTIITVPPMFYFMKLGQSFPWNLLAQGDIKFNLASFIPPQVFIFGIGPTLFLGIIGAIFILKRKDDLSYLLAPWSIVYLIGYTLLWKLIHFNSQRFLQTPFFVITGILSTLAIVQISNFVSRKVHFRKEILSSLIAITIILMGLPSIKKSLDINIENFKWAGDYTYYTNKENLEAIKWLEINTKEEDIVLAEKVNAELIAALAGNFCYYTIHATELDNLNKSEKTVRFDELENTVREFYTGVWNNEKAEKFLKNQKVKYIFWAEEEQNMANRLNIKYPFLTKVYENQKVTIFSLK